MELQSGAEQPLAFLKNPVKSDNKGLTKDDSTAPPETAATKLPTALAQFLPHNKPGKQEQPVLRPHS
ncbi:hypothetical protein RRG08_021540 [Elysia crispata]|uniref:Uncharacterized protein n=1 Tax=Elysia crispata TaxID=231223 RepID=A0AAE0XDG2_9GAST|nr:hypothetical protein RRG08_021540 [Elysia crispata]